MITREIAAAALRVYEVDARGLDRLDRAVLGALLKLFGGGPVGLSTLAVAVGEERETVEEVAEPFLVREGLLARTPRGRVATPAAWAHLGLVPPQQAPGKRTTGPVRGVTASGESCPARNHGGMLGVVPSMRTRLDSADAALTRSAYPPP